jgi:hypothetical protein
VRGLNRISYALSVLVTGVTLCYGRRRRRGGWAGKSSLLDGSVARIYHIYPSIYRSRFYQSQSTVSSGHLWYSGDEWGHNLTTAVESEYDIRINPSFKLKCSEPSQRDIFLSHYCFLCPRPGWYWISILLGGDEKRPQNAVKELTTS